MSIDDPTPNPVSQDDAVALVGVLAAMEGELLAGTDNDLWNRLTKLLRNRGTIPPKISDRAGLRIALANLNQRLRYALGDYDDVPEPDVGRADQYVRFDTDAKAAAFVQDMEGLGLRASQWPPDDARSQPYLVMVTTVEPVLSPGFDHRGEQIRTAAKQAGGFYEGWGGGNGATSPMPPS